MDKKYKGNGNATTLCFVQDCLLTRTSLPNAQRIERPSSSVPSLLPLRPWIRVRWSLRRKRSCFYLEQSVRTILDGVLKAAGIAILVNNSGKSSVKGFLSPRISPGSYKRSWSFHAQPDIPA